MQDQSTLYMAAQEIITVQTSYAKKGISLAQAALCGSKNYVEWQHYPKNDLVDSDSGYEFYYHSHSSEEMPSGEHGHFHLFKRDQNHLEKFHHLIGIALDGKGLPVRIFTTNQWVTGESMAKAPMVLKYLKEFNFSTKGKASPVAMWISSFVKLFYCEMEKLILKRDQKIDQLSIKMGKRSKAFESKRHSVITQRKIDLLKCLSKYALAMH
jgi:hypothetical protein